MRLLHVVGRLGFGGAEKLVFDLARRQKAYGDSVRVAVVSKPSGPDSEVAIWVRRIAELEAEGVPVHSLGRSTRDIVGAVSALRPVFAEQNMDVVHSHLLAGVVAARVSAGKSTPIVWTLHATRMGFPNRMIRLTQRWVDSYVGCAPAVSNAYQPFLGATISTVRNGVDLSEFVCPSRSFLDGRRRLIILSVGSLRAAKNYPRLVRAVAIANRHLLCESQGAELWIVGDGPERSAVERAIEVNDARSFVRVLGARPDVRVLLGKADMFALASDYEGLPLSLLEAMASGLPCLLTPFSGALEMLSPGQGAIVASTFSAEEMGELIASLVRDPHKRRDLSVAASRAAGMFDLRVCVNSYSKVYETAVENDRC